MHTKIPGCLSGLPWLEGGFVVHFLPLNPRKVRVSWALSSAVARQNSLTAWNAWKPWHPSVSNNNNNKDRSSYFYILVKQEDVRLFCMPGVWMWKYCNVCQQHDWRHNIEEGHPGVSNSFLSSYFFPSPPFLFFFNYMGVSAATLFAVPFLLIALFCLQAARLQYLKLFIAHLVSHHVSGVSSWIKSKHQLEPDRMANVGATSLPAASHSMVLVTAAGSV